MQQPGENAESEPAADRSASLADAAAWGGHFIRSANLTVPAILHVCDLATRCLRFVSPAITPLLGFEPAELVALGRAAIPMLVHPEDLEAFDLYVGRLKRLKDGEVDEHVFRLRDRAGHWHTFRSRDCVMVRGADGTAAEVFGSAFDITGEAMAVTGLQQAAAEKDQLIATLAHELRNPLAPIRTALAMMQRKGGADPHLVMCRDIIDRQVAQMARLLDDLLGLSREDRSTFSVVKARIDIAAVIHRSVEIARPVITAKGHRLGVMVPATPLHVAGDLERLSQVFSNLLINAAKYTDDAGEITITAEAGEAEVIVTVVDNGIGIPGELLQSVFAPFAQIDGNSHRSQGGLGIGLSVVRRIVEEHGGRVDAASEGLGKGSRFCVRLMREV